MKVAIRLVDGKDIFIEDAFKISTDPDGFFVRIHHPKGDVTINRNQIVLIEKFNEEDKTNE